MRNLAIAVAVSLGAASAPVRADVSAETWRFSLDTDPKTYPLHGFSGWVMAEPPGLPHFRFGAGGFGLEFPSFLVPVLDRTGEDGWGLEVRAAMGFASYQFGDRRGCTSMPTPATCSRYTPETTCLVRRRRTTSTFSVASVTSGSRFTAGARGLLATVGRRDHVDEDRRHVDARWAPLRGSACDSAGGDTRRLRAVTEVSQRLGQERDERTHV